MITARRICEICGENKTLTNRNYHEVRPGVFMYACRKCAGMNTDHRAKRKKKPSTDVAEEIRPAIDDCSHPAVRTTTQPGKYPMRGWCGACQRVLERATIDSRWEYHRNALPYGEQIVSQYQSTFTRSEDE